MPGLTLPTPNKTPGDGAPAGDMNLVIEAVSAVNSAIDNIPAGPQGAKGDTGASGAAGVAATVTVASTTTTAPGGDAQVVQSGTPQDAQLAFYIPRGAQGPQGATGSQGAIGPQGPQGPVGATGSVTPEVTALAVAAAQSAQNAATSASAAASSEAGVDADRVAAEAAASTATTQAGIATTKAGEAAVSATSASASSATAATSASAADASTGYRQGGKPVPVDAGRADEAEQLLKTAVWWIDAKSTTTTAQTVANLGWGGSALNATLGSGGTVDSNDPKSLPWTGENYVYLPGVVGNYLSVPDENALDITGDIDIRVRVLGDAWNATQGLVSKWQAGQLSYDFSISSGNVLNFRSSADGTATTVNKDSAAHQLVNGQPYWLRLTLDVDNGAGGSQVRFYKADDSLSEPTAWTEITPAPSPGGTTSIFSGTSTALLGQIGSGSLVGRYHRAIVKSGIDGPSVLDVDCSQITSGSQTSFLARTGQTVTVNRSTSGRKAVAVTQPCWLFGTDDYLSVADNSLLDFGASDSFSVVGVVRRHATQATDGVYLAKQDGATGLSGYRMVAVGTANTLEHHVADASTAAFARTITLDNGPIGVTGMVVDRSSQSLLPFLNGSFAAAVSISAIGSLENSQPLRVGVRSTGIRYNDMEGIAFAVFRKALTQYEIELLNDYYQSRDSGTDLQQPKKYVNMDAVPVGAKGDLAFNEQSQQLLVKQGDQWNGVLTEGSVLRAIPAGPAPAESLLKQAVWWIDANHNSASGQRVRNLGWGGSVLDATLGSSGAADSNDPKFLDFDGTPYVYLPGTTLNYFYNGQSAAPVALDTAGDLHIRVKVALDSAGVSQALAGRWVSGGQQFRWWLHTNNVPQFSETVGGVETTRAGSAAAPFTPGVASWFEVKRDSVAGTVTFGTSTDGVNWVQTGTAQPSYAGLLDVPTQALTFGVYSGTGMPTAGKFYRAQILNGINGTPVLDIDCSVLTSGSATLLQALTGQTVTINRSTSGRKSVAGVAPVWLFGTDDYMEVPDNDLLDFGASDSFTVVAAYRSTDTGLNAIVSKSNSTSAGATGWMLLETGGAARAYIGDGTAITYDETTRASGALTVLAGVRDAANDTIGAYVNGSATPVTDTTTGTLANTLTVRVGSIPSGSGSYFAEMEFLAAAVFRRALTQTEIQTLTDYYAGR